MNIHLFMLVVAGSRLRSPIIAVCFPATAKNSKVLKFEETPMAQLSLPSIKATAPRARIYVAIDDDDTLLMAWKEKIEEMATVIVVPGRKNHIPHNELTKKAYDDGSDYIVRINDDTEFVTASWVEFGIEALVRMNPPNVGVVAPMTQKGPKDVFTHDMVHRTHIDIFGEYYPKVFHNWYLDDWITRVYEPGRSKRIENWEVNHPVKETRYEPDKSQQKLLQGEVERGKVRLETWIASLQKKVISYSLYGTRVRYLDGALENPVLAKTIYPGWIVRYYIDKTVPAEIIKALDRMDNVEIVYAPEEIRAPMMWRFLVASDPSVDTFVVRDADSRISKREKFAVDEWMASGKKFHVMRDHPSHSLFPMSGGLWGGRGDAFPAMEKYVLPERRWLYTAVCEGILFFIAIYALWRLYLEKNGSGVFYTSNSKRHLLIGVAVTTAAVLLFLLSRSYEDKYLADMIFLTRIVWPEAKKSIVQHDSFSCKKYGGSPFPVARTYPGEHVGSVFLNGRERSEDVEILLQTPQPLECRPF